ncbi:Small, acid-soluble spore protein, alpha/beta type [Paenibacillus sp. UNC496MF]|nr:Small, acid-soluble spore protein, alpha/beta type [Paenibacillus sp. UNC496MF]
MSRKRRSTMSEQLKNELAKDLGFYDTVQKEGWGGIKAKDAGNMVKRAIQLAEQAAAREYQAQQAQQAAQPQAQAYRAQPQAYRAQAYQPQAYQAQAYQQPPAQGASSAYNAAQPRQTGAAGVPPYMHQALPGAQQASPSMPH